MHRAFNIVKLKITRDLTTLFLGASFCQLLPLFMLGVFQFLDTIYSLIIAFLAIPTLISFWIISVNKTLKLKDISYPFVSLLFYILISTLLIFPLFGTLHYFLELYVPYYGHKMPVIYNICDCILLLFFIIQPLFWHLLAAKIEKRKLTFRIHIHLFFTFILLTVIGYLFLSPIISLFDSIDQNLYSFQRMMFSLIFSFISSEGIYYLWLKEVFEFKTIEQELKKVFTK